MGLRLFVFKKFIPIITGRDKFFKTTAEPENMVERLFNLILTSKCPTVSIIKFELAPFAESNSDSTKFSIFPLKLLMKKYSLIATPVGIRAPVSIKIFVFSKFLPVHSMSIDIAPSRNEVASRPLVVCCESVVPFLIVELALAFDTVRFLSIFDAVRMLVILTTIMAY